MIYRLLYLSKILTAFSVVVILSTLLVSPVMAASYNTTIGTLELVSTFECIGVYANFSGDDNSNNSATLSYRIAGSGASFTPGMELTVDRRSTVADSTGTSTNPFADQWRGSILGLQPNTTYEVRVTFSDSDGVSGTNPASTTVTTRSDSFPLGSGNIYYVATNGSDSASGTFSNPWRTIQHAENSVSAGDTVYIRGGTYTENLTFNVKGTANNLITFIPYSGESVIIDGGNTSGNMINFNNADYIRISNITVQNAQRSLFYLTSGSSGNIIEYCTLRDFGREQPDAGITLRGESNYNTIQNNTITSSRVADSDSTHREAGISFAGYTGWSYPGIGNVVRYNQIISVNFGISDGIGGLGNNTIIGGPYKDSDIYGNTIVAVGDDGIEAEGGGINVRIWDNTIEYPHYSALGLATVTIGPMYVFRNTCYDLDFSAVKTGYNEAHDGHTYLYHNSFYSTQMDTRTTGIYNMGGSGYTRNFHSLNNILSGTSYQICLSSTATHSSNSFNYDCLWSTDSSGDRLIQWNGTVYANSATKWSAFQSATGQELNGVRANPLYVSPSTGNLQLQSGSPCIDAGVILLGFNDINSPWPFNSSGPDIGAYEYGSGGPTADTSAPYTSGHSPGKYSSDISKSTNITVHVLDSNSGVNQSSIVMQVEGVVVSPSITGSKYDYTLMYNPPTDFSYNQVVNVTVDAQDLASTPNTMAQDAYSFTIESESGDDGNGDDGDEPLTGISVPFRVNCAGADYTDTGGNLWHKDQAYQSGSWGYYGTSSTIDRGTSTTIANTQDDRIYQTERYSLSGYRFDIDNGSYDISLLFAENYISQSGDRVFDVTVEGQLKLDNLDVYSEVGMNTALIKTISNVSVTDGQLNITFGSYIENPMINGIMIATSSGSNNKAPVAVSDYYSTTLNTTLSVSSPGILGNDYDANNDTINANLVKYVTHGNVTINPNGSFIYIPDSGYTGTDSFSYRAHDGTSYSNTAIVIISVNDSGGSGGDGDLPTGGDSGSSGGSSGSTGGGGSPAGSVNDTGSDETAITNVYNYVSSSGKFNSDVVANSNDANVNIYIPQNTIGSNNMGLKLMNIAITKLNQTAPSPPNSAVILGGVYDLSPDGAKFNPTIKLSMSYNKYQIPAGVSEKNLVIGMYDWTNERWQPIPSFVQYYDGIVTAEIGHFSTYAVLAYTSPAIFDVTQITTSAESIAAGSDMDIQALVVNHGDLTDTCTICCMIDSVSYAMEEVTLDGGDSTTVTFKVTPEILGMHTIQIGLLESTFTVTKPYKPATFTTSSINISPSEIYLGETVEISTLVNNIGDLSGTYEAILKMDNKYIDSKSLEVSGGDSDIIIFTLEPKTEGEHAVNIGNKVAFFEVKSVVDVDVDIINRPDPEIDHFGLIPSYDPEKGTIEFARIEYQITNADQLSSEALLVLTVFHNSEVLEEKSLAPLDELEGNEISGSIEYEPSDGWDTGTYIFEAELKEPSGIVHSIQFEKFTLIEESITKAVSWGSLGIIIGGTLVVLFAVLAIVIYRRREMLRGYVE
jgi:hypothetical protein